MLIRKEPAQNTYEVHDTVYMLRDPSGREAARETIARGLTDAAEHAHLVGAMRLVLGGDAETLVELSDDPELAAAIARGDLDTATAACADFTHSPHNDPGLPCTASFLLCLACPNAVATPTTPAAAGPPARRVDRTARRPGHHRVGAAVAAALSAGFCAVGHPHHRGRTIRRSHPDHRCGPHDHRPAAPQDIRRMSTAPASNPSGGQHLRWDLSPLNTNDHQVHDCLNWQLFPLPLRPAFRRAGWALVNLRVGCCPEPGTDDPHPHGYQIHGNYFKDARDGDGKHVVGGLPRDTPWTAIAPVVRAVRVLERMADGPLLFPVKTAWASTTSGSRKRRGEALTCQGANGRIAAFTAWLNDYAARRNHPRRSARPGSGQPLPANPRLAHRPPARRPRRGSRCSTGTCAPPRSPTATPDKPATDHAGSSTSKPHEPWPTTSTPSPIASTAANTSPDPPPAA
ncbi:hypothetical protein COO55_18910 [Rhodococcus opacus]|nr:hypothetical protein COO55_18910 [Rhodococcus opacus]